MGRKEIWTIEKFKEGFEKFYKDNGRFPSGPEIDICGYLPSSRQIQRRFKGGLPELRGILGIKDVHLGRGEFRSAIAFRTGGRGYKAERELEKILIDHFGEVFVHIEKPINSEHGKTRYDFFVYAKKFNFGVDIFCADNRQTLMKNLDFKIDSYRDTTVPLYLVEGAGALSQEILDDVAKAKKTKPLPTNARLLTLNNFLELIKEINPRESFDDEKIA